MQSNGVTKLRTDDAIRTMVMGIVNVTPDSFSDGGSYIDPKAAIRHAYQMLDAGADVLDIGAESTRPSAVPVPSDEEWRRLQPVLAELCQNTRVVISVDTYKADIARRALTLGVGVINDVWGGLADAEMLSTVAEAGCTYIWMHNRNHLSTGDGVDVLLSETRNGIDRCFDAGIQPDKLWIDPGIGFGKTYEQNLSALRNLHRYTELGHPVALGTSRKSVIGQTLQLPVEDRLEGSLSTVALGVWQGVKMVRVHDVLPTVRTCRMVEAIMYGQQHA